MHVYILEGGLVVALFLFKIQLNYINVMLRLTRESCSSVYLHFNTDYNVGDRK
jgi:hypothetical protein